MYVNRMEKVASAWHTARKMSRLATIKNACMLQGAMQCLLLRITKKMYDHDYLYVRDQARRCTPSCTCRCRKSCVPAFSTIKRCQMYVKMYHVPVKSVGLAGSRCTSRLIR